MVICLERDADLHMAQLMPLPLTVSCFGKIQIGFSFLVLAHLGSPGKRAIKRVCVCVCFPWQDRQHLIAVQRHRRTRRTSAAAAVCVCVNRGTMGVSLPKTVTGQRRGCDLNPSLTARVQHTNHLATEPPVTY